MRINIFPIVSSLHEANRINEETQLLLKELSQNSDFEINITDIDCLYDADLSLILIQSGGSEQLFLENFDKLKEPYYLLTYGSNNSLAASLEILSYIKDNHLKGEVLHGSVSYLTKRFDELCDKNENKEKKYRYGVIGKPSDWLIASNVNYEDALTYHGIELRDISIDELIRIYNNFDGTSYKFDCDFDHRKMNDAFNLYRSLQFIQAKYHLDGLTIRCFDLLDKIKTTACLGLSLLNRDKICCSCEGDIPTLISMHILKNITGQVGFQANPSKIDIENKKMIFAHCTLPLDMTTSYKYDTHFESGIGVAIKGELKEETITIFKLSNNLKDYFVTTGKIIKNLNESNLCRTQIEIEVDKNIEYFLNRPYGNHHVIIYGDYKEKIIEYFNK